MNVISRLPLLAVALSPLTVTHALAAESVDKVVVTASRYAETIDQALAPVSVITREDIDKSPAANLQELLSSSPGIDITSNGGHGKTSSLLLRGTSTEHVLYLIDGVKIGSATAGSASIQQFPLSQIERIEVVRGPRSSLYGAEAIGGVIQIFTRKGADGFKPTASVSVGNQDTREVNTSIRGGNESTSFSLTLGHFETGGVDVLPGNNLDKDGYKNDSLSANLNSDLSERLNASFTLLRTQDENAFDSTFTTSDRSSKSVQQVLASKFTYQVNDGLDLSLQLSESRDESDDITNGVVSSVFDTRRRTVDLQADYYVNDNNTLNVGASFEEESVDATTSFDSTSRDQDAVFVQWQSDWDRLEALLGLRSDDYDSFGRHNTGNLNLGYRLDGGRKVLFSYGEGFHVPTFNDLYFPFTNFGFFTFQGNPNLKPEESKSFELGYQKRTETSFWAVRIFRTEIKNLISLTNTSKANLDSALIKGIEFEWAGQVEKWDVKFSTTFLDATDESTGNVLRRRAEKTAQLDFSRQHGQWTTGVSLLAQGHRYDDSANTKRLAGYAVTNLKLRYRIDQDWSLTARVNDLFDRDFTTVLSGSTPYNSPGRTFLFGVDYGI